MQNKACFSYAEVQLMLDKVEPPVANKSRILN